MKNRKVGKEKDKEVKQEVEKEEKQEDKKVDKEEKQEVEKETNDKRLTKTYDSIVKNWITWVIKICAIIIICHYTNDSVSLGMVTFLLVILYYYFGHMFLHETNFYIISCVHRYHHTHNNWFSDLIEILLELNAVPCTYLFLYFIFNITFLNPWIILFTVLFFSSHHNINYARLHINSIHDNHDIFINKNYSFDICDIFFGTKAETTPEDITHYIPNIIVSTLIVLGLQYLWKSNSTYKNYISYALYSFTFIATMFLFIVSCYFCKEKQSCKKINLK